MNDMGILQCQVCKNSAVADTKDEALTKIDHSAKSKRCSGKDELCVWYAKGIPEPEPERDIDPKRPIEGVNTSAKLKATDNPAPKKSK